MAHFLCCLFGDGCGQKKWDWKFGTSQHKKEEEEEEEKEAPLFVLVIVIAIFVWKQMNSPDYVMITNMSLFVVAFVWMQFQCFSPLRKSSFDFKLGDQTAERFVVLLDTLAAGADK